MKTTIEKQSDESNWNWWMREEAIQMSESTKINITPNPNPNYNT